MQVRQIQGDDTRMFAVIFEEGEEVMQGLRQCAEDNDLSAAGFTAIGAFSSAKLGFFDVEKKEYIEIDVPDQVEVLTFTGNIARHEAAPKVHAHVVVGRRDGATIGGHVLQAHVRPTLEVMLTEAPAHLQREIDARTGLPLLIKHERS